MQSQSRARPAGKLIGIYDDQADVLNVLTDSETGEAGRLYLLGMGLDLAARDERDWADDVPSDITSEQERPDIE